MSNNFWEKVRSSADATHEQTNKTLDELQKTVWTGAGAAKKGADTALPHVRRWLESIGIRFS